MYPSLTESGRPDYWLQNAARLTLSALISRLDLEMAARPTFWVDFRGETPCASHSYWDYCDIAGRYADAFVLARAMTGTTEAADEESALRRFLWAQQDVSDGLFYSPEGEGGRDSEISKYLLDPDALAKRPRHVDMFCQRAPLLALTTLIAAGDEQARERSSRLVRGLAAIAERTGDECSFTSYRWAPVMKPEWYEGKVAPERWLGYRYALLTGLARLVELEGGGPAEDLSLGLARWYMRHGDVPADGRFRANTHSGGVLPTLVGIARLGRYAGDVAMLDWCDSAYVWVTENIPDFGFLPDGFGLEGFFSTTSETRAIADLIHLALVLTEAGVGDYYDDIERIARNQLLENQYRDESGLRQAFPGIADDVKNMLWGGFECAAFPNRLLTWDGAEGCCIGGGLRALYLTWRGAVSESEGETRVHLGFSRTTDGASIIGHEPWAGLIEVRVRTPRRVLIRLPEQVAAGQVQALLDGQPVKLLLHGRYADFEDLRVGQTAAISYPLHDSRRSYEVAGQGYTGFWRGSTMMAIAPAGERYPIYERSGLLASGDPVRPDAAEPRLPSLPALW